ncbi:SulP family inorganic anion transporter [Amycolatopsis anabasis]|uniref:SulP family inorganic anion transporter n=1 Tax=Amycolatopsis anabasis TaxID=1840409 RepID=UPI00131E8808|nr:SulP family inorganic anion transporter [Amycolatopsis anabasis]
MNWSVRFPRTVRRYRRAWLRGDLIGGITVAAYLVPQVMAYAEVAGLPPVAGLWAITGPLAVYPFLGSSRQLSIGPESTTALMTAVVLAPLAAGDPGRYATLAAVLALLVGGLCLLGWLIRVGFLADLLSKPVLVGYMAGIAVLMTAGQLGTTTGVPISGESFAAQVGSFASGAGNPHWPTVALAAAVLALLFTGDRFWPRAPGALVAILLATAVVAMFSLREKGIQVVGEIPSGLPEPALPDVHAGDLPELLLPATGIALVSFSDNVLTARAFGSRHGEDVDAGRELRALGAANLTAGFLRGFPVSSSGSRTALADAAGSRTQLYSLVALAGVLVTLAFAGPILAGFPKAALGALVIYAATRLVNLGEFHRIARFRRSEFLLTLLTTAAVLGLVGVASGALRRCQSPVLCPCRVFQSGRMGLRR